MLAKDLFRNKDDVKTLRKAIESLDVKDINIMEVCGTHTMAIAEAGIKQMLPKGINLISGPGCPVCVTPSERIDDICNLAMNKDIIITTYGDMIRVPGTRKDISLEKSRMMGADIKAVYSSMDALDIAIDNPDREVVFLGIGFETTAPAAASALMEAYKRKVDNFSIFSLHKVIEPAIRSLLESKEVKIDGFLLPGHVAVILGQKGFMFLQYEYAIPGVISGFEPVDILNSLFLIAKEIAEGRGEVKNEYTRLVSFEGNSAARDAVYEVFKPRDDIWRGLGMIKNSGLKIREKYSRFDAEVKFKIKLTDEIKNTPCKCGDVVKGLIDPSNCPLFGKECVPDSPVGPCMVSSEGSCAAAYKYRNMI